MASKTPKKVISILNMKHGMGVSKIAYSLAPILGLTLYGHDKSNHNYFIEQRNYSNEDGSKTYVPNIQRAINVQYINKRKVVDGIYDLGSDLNYAYMHKIIQKSSTVIIPIELGFENALFTIASIELTRKFSPNAHMGTSKNHFLSSLNYSQLNF